MKTYLNRAHALLLQLTPALKPIAPYLQNAREKALWPLVKWLRANPLGPALTACLSGFAALLAVPQLSIWLFGAPKLVLTEVILFAPLVPYSMYRVHQVSWKPQAALWSAIYLLSLIRTPLPLKVMSALAISAHMTGWFIWGLLWTGLLGLFLAKRPQPEKTPSVYDRMSSSEAG